MSSIPNDPDEDDIKDILESMWELTSGNNRDDFYTSDSSEEISNSQKNEQRQPSSHFRLIDALDGLRTPATSEHVAPRLTHGHSSDDWGPEIGSDSNASARHQLSSLNPTADGRFVASMQMEQPMPTDSGQNPHNGQPAQFNGNGHDILNGNQPNVNTLRPNESAPITAGNISPGPTMSGDKLTPDDAQKNTTAPATPASPAVNKESGEVKRVMASFFDNKLNQMGGKVAPKAPAPQAAAPIQTAPIQQPAPIQAAPNPPASAPPVQASVPVQQQVPPTPLQPVQAPAVPQAPVHEHHAAHDSAAELMRPVLRQWLGENMPKIVESALQIEAAQTMHPDDTKKPDK